MTRKALLHKILRIPNLKRTMATSVQLPPDVNDLVTRLGHAVSRTDPQDICEGVKNVLQDIAAHGARGVPDSLFAETEEGYARRLLYQSPDQAYSVLVMVWAAGQGSAIHDHAGKWCVEGVLRGAIAIDTYDFAGDPSTDDVVHLGPAVTATATVGDVGILVPPNEYHAIRNAADETAVTVHVYEGEMLWCHTFRPLEGGGYRRDQCALTITEPSAF